MAAYVPRATRYAIPLSVFYRSTGASDWSEGRTENISNSGVLVRGDRRMVLDTPVEMVVNIPSNVTAPFAGTMVCRGRIVRAVCSPGSDSHAFAVALLGYETAQFVAPPRS